LTLLEHREQLTGWVQQACNDGASLYRSCAVVGISVHSWYRWQQDGVVSPDQRPLVDRPEPANKLCVAERQAVLALCNSPRFDSVPPSQIVPILADEGRYLASESTMYRVLRAAGLVQHRGRAAKAVRKAKPTSFTATAPNQVWMWDVTWLPSRVKGQYYKLYLFEDLFSRYPVGWEVHDEETGELAADLLQRSVLAQRCAMKPLVLHSDNGAPMKSYTLKAKMEALGITSSFSRPRVSNDNPFAESIFRTLKYWPAWPKKGFASLDESRQWVKRFIDWYCHAHRHSGIQFVTPAQRHQGLDKTLLAKRHQVYQAARAARPERWQGKTRNWDWSDAVQLNPDRPITQKKTENLLAA
jgi:putative transposase